MTAAAAASSLVSEGLAQHTGSTYRPSQHDAHGCCQDPTRFGTVRDSDRAHRTLLGVAESGAERAIVMTLRCRSWRCPCCAVRLRRKARARAFQGACGSRVAMLTLTIDRTDPRYGDPRNRPVKRRKDGSEVIRPRSSVMLGDPRAAVVETSTRYASWAWNRFRTYLVREHGPVPYFRGLELQQSGVAHLHVLIRLRDLPEFLALQRLINGPTGLAVRAGFGPVVDVQLARSSGDVARYVTKADGGGAPLATTSRPGQPGQHAAAYVSKLPATLPRYTRRAAWSLKSGRAPWAPAWAEPTRIAGYTWRVAHASESTVRAALVASDFSVVDPATLRVPLAPDRAKEAVWPST